MSNKNSTLLTPNQLYALLIGFTSGVGILSLPNFLVKYTYQDSWIAAILGGTYPLYIGVLAIYISRKFPKDNILAISKKKCGSFIGGLLNFIFMTYFIFNYVVITAGFNNVSRVYINPYLSSDKIVITITAAAIIAACAGIKVLGKLNEVIYYILLIIIILCSMAFPKGSIKNLFPVFQSNGVDILNGIEASMFSYSGIEAIFLLYPFVNDSAKIKKTVMKFIIVIVIIYTYITFITIYYFSSDIILKNFWSFVEVAESVNISVIASFKYLFVFLWIPVALRMSFNYFYASIFILKDFLKKVSFLSLSIMVAPILIYLTSKLTDEYVLRSILKLIVPKYVMFMILYISLISLLIFLKKGERNEIT